MVSAPSGRVRKKKNARAARITTEIRIVIRFAVVPSSRMHPLSLSLSLSLYFLPMHVTSLHPVSCPLSAHARRFIACTTYFLRFLLPSFERRCCGASLWESPWRRVWQSSLTRQCSRHDRKKVACMMLCHRPNQTSTYTTNIYDRDHTYAFDRFSWRKNWWQSIGIALFIYIWTLPI